MAAREILDAARDARESELGALAVELARQVLLAARQLERMNERAVRDRTARLLASERTQRLVLALTDRVHRSRNASRTVATIAEAARRIGTDASQPLIERWLLCMLRLAGSLFPATAANAVKQRIAGETEPFVFDASPGALDSRLAQCKRDRARVNLNQLGEEVLSEAEALRHVDTYMHLLDRDDIDAVSVKISGVYSQVQLMAFDHCVAVVSDRLKPVLAKAGERKKLVYFDMEAFRDLELTVAVFERLVLDRNLLGVTAGIALQAYLPDTLAIADRLVSVAYERVRSGGDPLRIRLVKGANLAAESVEASLHRWASPIFPNKALVDAHFKRLLERLLRAPNADSIRIGVGSHNLFDQSYALLLAEHRHLTKMQRLEMLQGMAGSFGRVFAELIGGILLYTPAVLPEHFPSAVAYLVRRLDENTGAENFLARSAAMQPNDTAFVEQSEAFLSALALVHEPIVPSYRRQNRAQPHARVEQTGPLAVFDNVDDTDLTRPENRQYIAERLHWAQVNEHLVLPRVDGADRSSTPEAGFDPSRPEARPYWVHWATPADIERALQVGNEAAAAFANVLTSERVHVVDRVADELERMRGELIALMVLDSGKRVQEADLEVSEAIDLARYYARSYEASSEQFDLKPRGLTIVTPPWNFPLAIPLGGCLAALVSGNPVILKPAPETPLVARALAQACWQAGVPERALQFLPCRDDHASRLITDNRVRTVVLTGATSTAEAFLRLRPHLHLLAETGGKNATYVSGLADRDHAISHIIQSAFGHAGQKCSALSALVLEGEVFDDAEFERKLVEAVASLHVGSAWDAKSFVTPLIRPPSGALARVLQEGQAGARWALAPVPSTDNPRLVSPGILWNVEPGSFVHRTELFGPVLAVLRARDLEEGLRVMNDTPYGLTAGIFTLSEDEQQQFAAGMDAGNLYVNRGITGAVVGRQPFGGHKASSFGPGAKAGGPDYVLQFCHVQSRATTSHSLARGNLPSFTALFPRRSGTPVVGEQNWLRYHAAPVTVVVGEGVSNIDCRRIKHALEIAGIRDATQSVQQFMARTAAQSAEPSSTRRLRLVGSAPDAFFERAAALGASVISDPIDDDPEVELRHYVQSQVLSVAYHRYGNVNLKSLNPLLVDPDNTRFR